MILNGGAEVAFWNVRSNEKSEMFTFKLKA